MKSSIVFHTLVAMALAASSLFAAGGRSDGPRVGLRLVVVNDFGEGMGEARLKVTSDAGSNEFLVRDSGVALAVLTPGSYRIESYQGPKFHVKFAPGLATFQVPDTSGDLSLGTVVLTVVPPPVDPQMKGYQEGSMGGGALMGGVMAAAAAASMAKAEGDLRIRWNDKLLTQEMIQATGRSDTRRIPLKIDRSLR